MRIALLLHRRTSILSETVRLLEERGAKVDWIFPEKQVISLASVRVEHDLYVIKSGTSLTLSLAGALHAAGALTLNPYPTVARLCNKIVASHILKAAGIPTPDTFVAADTEHLASMLDSGPYILKPYLGTYGRGVRLIYRADEVFGIPQDDPILVQRYHKPDGDGRDYKIYRIGDQMFGVRRIWPIHTDSDKKGEPFTINSELREIVLACGRAFGLDLYGLDIVISKNTPYVVDVNKFGSYMGVPDAPQILANYIHAVALRAVRRELPLAASHKQLA